jgi:hypothetical protein
MHQKEKIALEIAAKFASTNNPLYIFYGLQTLVTFKTSNKIVTFLQLATELSSNNLLLMLLQYVLE